MGVDTPEIKGETGQLVRSGDNTEIIQQTLVKEIQTVNSWCFGSGWWQNGGKSLFETVEG